MNKFQEMADKREMMMENMSDVVIFRTMVETILSKPELDQSMKVDFLRHSFEDHSQLIIILEDLILSNFLPEREGRQIISALQV